MTTERGHVVQTVLTLPGAAEVQVFFRRFGRVTEARRGNDTAHLPGPLHRT